MAHHLLSQIEHERRTKLLFSTLKRNSASTQEVNELFYLHNDIFDPHETGKHCGTCKSRVYNKMLKYYNTLIPNEK